MGVLRAMSDPPPRRHPWRRLRHDLVGAPAQGIPGGLSDAWPARVRRSPKLTSSFYLQLSGLTASLVEARDRYLAPGVSLLDIGCGERPYLPVFAPVAAEHVGADLLPGPGILYVGPAEELGAPDASFDVALSTQMLEHARDPLRCIAEMRRVLKPGGLALISTHGVWPYHPVPQDYWRWTHEGLRTLVADAGGLEVLEIMPHRSTPACLASLSAYYLNLLAAGTLLERLCMYMVAALNVAGVIGDRLVTRFDAPGEHSLILSYLVIARRVG